ncbi:MAG: glycoside hydrolase family 127 protein, partial [Bacteroidaceae bacterium]|nr:glycoside hydrolase family 127 protein [Bacteroidaceae bacterium]
LPAWCKNPVVKLNGKTLDGATSGTYLKIDRKWRVGDCITLHFPMEEKWVMRENHSNYPSYTLPGGEIMYKEEPTDMVPYAFLRGPIVYCVDMVWNKHISNDDANLARDMRIDVSKLPQRQTFNDTESVMGPVYQADANYMGRNVKLTLTPFCNVGQWWRPDEQKPWRNSNAFTYAIWMYK